MLWYGKLCRATSCHVMFILFQLEACPDSEHFSAVCVCGVCHLPSTYWQNYWVSL